MSSEIYAKPTKVRHNRKVDDEWEESEVVIYESADGIGDDYADIQSYKSGPLTEKHPPDVQTRPFRAAAFCLGVLCFLMIMGIILLSIMFTLEKEQLQSRHDQLSNNNSQLQEKVSDLSVNQSRLQEEVKQLKGKIEEKWCPEGWSRFGCSCYFQSNEKKTWDDSRKDCQEKGADLVVINNKEEQIFVSQLNKMHEESWIGLWGKWMQGKWEWKWVDSSPLREMFWATGQPYSDGSWLAATCCNQEGKWTQSRYYSKKWICEK